MRRQNKRALYESIMRDVARVVKRRLNEGRYDFDVTNTDDDVDYIIDDINLSKKKLSEYTFRDILNPKFNIILHNDSPDIIKLDADGRIGFDVYVYKTLRDANLGIIPNSQKPSFVLYEDNIAFAIAKLFFLVFDQNKIFGDCNPKVSRFINFLMDRIPEFKYFVYDYSEELNKIKNRDKWFINHPRRDYNVKNEVLIKCFGDEKESARTINDIFIHFDHILPLEDFVRRYL